MAGNTMTIQFVPFPDWEGMSKATDRELSKVVSRTAHKFRSTVVQLTPVHTGALRNAWQVEVEHMNTPKVKATVRNATFYAPVVEFGRRPGKMPPVDALVPWVRQKIGLTGDEARNVAFLIARKIARVGTEGAHMVEKSIPPTIDFMSAEASRAGFRIVQAVV